VPPRSRREGRACGRPTRAGAVCGSTVAAKTAESPDYRWLDREARAVAALSHPNICAIFDVGQDGRTAYLVMEFLEGETLAVRLAGGGRAAGSRTARGGSDAGFNGTTEQPPAAGRPPPIAETLGIAVQLANALAAAHTAGIVHRDLKPSNILLLRGGVTQQGSPQVKVLDFGLARIATAASPTTEAEVTIAAPLTGIGMLVGTVPYMAPEQVEGREADARSDIFSLGSVIYEMATGRRAFDAPSQAGVIAAILERQPEPITRVQPMTPPALERIVRGCLAKTPADRWQHASDVARQLAWLVSESESGATVVSSSPAPATGKESPPGWRSFGWPHAIAGAALLLLAADLAWRPPGRSGTRQSAAGATAVHMPLGIPGVNINGVHVSPDGLTLAISGTSETYRAGHLDPAAGRRTRRAAPQPRRRCAARGLVARWHRARRAIAARPARDSARGRTRSDACADHQRPYPCVGRKPRAGRGGNRDSCHHTRHRSSSRADRRPDAETTVPSGRTPVSV
jgi:hypothetical protein